MDKNFSILMNSRGRPVFLEQGVIALNELAATPSKNEILIGLDDDDAESIKVGEDLVDRYTNVHVHVKPRTKNLHKYINEMSACTQGKYLWVVNDDASIVDLDWDMKISEAINKTLEPYPDRIGYFSLPTNSSDKIGDYAEFPLITREAYNALGFFEYEKTQTWGADVILHKIYNSIGRIFKLNCLDYPIRHILHENGTQPNKTRADMEKIFIEEFSPSNKWNEAVGNFNQFLQTIDVSEYTNILKEKIG